MSSGDHGHFINACIADPKRQAMSTVPTNVKRKNHD